MPSLAEIQRLREQLSLKGAGVKARAPEADGFGFGLAALDEKVGALGRRAVHEIYAAASDSVCADGMALALAMRASDGPFLWAYEGGATARPTCPMGRAFRAGALIRPVCCWWRFKTLLPFWRSRKTACAAELSGRLS